MIRDITIGQYYPGYSWVHKLDSRLKIIMTFLYLVSLFLIKDFGGYLVAILALATMIIISKIPFRFMIRGLKPIMIIIIFTFTLNMLMTGGTVLVKLGPLSITQEGLRLAVFMAMRLILLILGSSLLTLTTKPMKLTDAIESLLKPFRRIGVPAHEFAMMMTIALRYIPTLLDETDKIMKAQSSRGADFETGNLLARARKLIPLLVPLFIGAFRIAQDLALAMEARCYRGGEGRTKMHELKFRKRDLAALLMTLFYLGMIIGERILYGMFF